MVSFRGVGEWCIVPCFRGVEEFFQGKRFGALAILGKVSANFDALEGAYFHRVHIISKLAFVPPLALIVCFAGIAALWFAHEG